ADARMDRAQMGGAARRWFRLAVNRRSTKAHHGNRLFAPMKVRPDFSTAPAASGALQRGAGRRFLRLPASSRYLRNASWMKSETDRPRCEAARSIARLVPLGTSIDSSTASVMRPMMAPIGPDGKALGVVVRQPRHRRPSVPPLRRKIG